jgi:haloalkane dehalogenase
LGLSYAIEQPDNVRGIVIFNTWLWSLTKIPGVVLGSTILGSPFGRWLNRRTNFDPRVILPSVTADKSKLTPLVRRHYEQVFPRPQDRNAPVSFARHLAASGPWYDELWAQRARLRHIPALILWGMRDPLLKPRNFLEPWKTVFESYDLIQLPETGHFVQEERREELVPLVRAFLQNRPT